MEIEKQRDVSELANAIEMAAIGASGLPGGVVSFNVSPECARSIAWALRNIDRMDRAYKSMRPLVAELKELRGLRIHRKNQFAVLCWFALLGPDMAASLRSLVEYLISMIM
ncbi:hypothetical protein KL86PLE_100296 [uncultured Pleomorphomonas sp.]|uniref:Uncharacterized protein n=1 Tax=uncultured Pleomorphomonas sp. TaxID=442121 RepID=A0A212L269_9HYPH|nr:hypothetical protein [uncultured Pleomorphomonas sp.]SCM71642.1 hypothetical protein KL86PLE_100296 [uncultured Pleomorphomonas sp.]